jgi:hypothetical protein
MEVKRGITAWNKVAIREWALIRKSSFRCRMWTSPILPLELKIEIRAQKRALKNQLFRLASGFQRTNLFSQGPVWVARLRWTSLMTAKVASLLLQGTADSVESVP